jgi:putative glutamine amidotransferase
MRRIRLILLIALLPLAACCGRRSAVEPLPLVGLSCGRSDSGANTLGTTYTDAILRAGGLPLVFPTVSDETTARELVARVDGVVFTGGPDFDPAIYGEGILNETVEIDAVRDRSDLLLARAALDSGKPILAICRGGQLMNIALGGTLYQDIPSQVTDPDTHGGGAVHAIGLEPGSTLRRLFGVDSLQVNSFHHQAVKDPAPGIRIAARAPDGLVEAFETDQVLAVQFHPEKMVQTDTAWLRLFRHFLAQTETTRR